MSNQVAIAARIVEMFSPSAPLRCSSAGTPYRFNKKLINGHIVETYEILGGTSHVEVDTTGTKHLTVAEAIEIISAP